MNGEKVRVTFRKKDDEVKTVTITLEDQSVFDLLRTVPRSLYEWGKNS